MLMTKERWPAIRTLRSWAILALSDAGARSTLGCRTGPTPHARDRAFQIAREAPPPGASPAAAAAAAAAAITEVLDSIGDTCHDWPPD